jgi:signal peptide peptidase SppA
VNLSDLCGLWAIRGDELRLLASGQALAGRGGNDASGSRVQSGVAVIPIHGVLSKSPAWWSDGSSTLEIRQQVSSAAASPAVSSILLHVDSPGGTVSGTAELADDVRAAAAAKPTVAYIADLGASASYWVASQASKVYSNRSALVGGVGTFALVFDASGMFERAGVKVHTIKAGQFKGAGAFGTKIEAEHLAEWQKHVNALNEHFLSAVGSGRRMNRKQVEALADGRVHVGADAARLGLTDGVFSFEQVFQSLAAGQASALPTAAGNGKPKMYGSAKEQLDELIAAKVASNPRMPRARAYEAVMRENPELRQMWIEEHNAEARAKASR